jgi:hypothetical protein
MDYNDLEKCKLGDKEQGEWEGLIQQLLNAVLLAAAPQCGLVNTENIGSLLQ